MAHPLMMDQKMTIKRLLSIYLVLLAIECLIIFNTDEPYVTPVVHTPNTVVARSHILQCLYGVSGMEADTLASVLQLQGWKHGVDWSYFAALIRVESGFNRYAKSPAGACGYTQLMPGTFQLYLATTKKVGSIYGVYHNIDAGAWYLAQGYKTTGSWDAALRRYNGGPNYAINARNSTSIHTAHTAFVASVLHEALTIQQFEKSLYTKYKG